MIQTIKIKCGEEPGGNDRAIQFNDNGKFAGSDNLQWVEDYRGLGVTVLLVGGGAMIAGDPATGGLTLYGGGDEMVDEIGGSCNVNSGGGTARGGDFTLSAGNVTGETGQGGGFVASAGSGPIAGSVNFSAGNSSLLSQPGGDVQFTSGNASGELGIGGSIVFAVGSGPMGPGAIRLQVGSIAAYLNLALLTASRLIAFPDADGTLALQSAASGSFTTADGKTVTVVNGIITEIV